MDYYNEIDPYAAQMLRNLIDAGKIAPGWVDTRSIEDVKPNELTDFRRCHFFAGIGGWALALEIAGWPSDRRVWTGSCPCQPFSAAGKGNGFADERHLWPAWQHLIAQCQPPVVFGEQVASKAVDAWIDLVHADMEGMGYSFGSIPFPAAGVGAPHIRDRNYWVAYSDHERRDRERLLLRTEAIGRGSSDLLETSRGGQIDRLGHAGGQGLSERQRQPRVLGQPASSSTWKTAERGGVHACGMADTDDEQSQRTARDPQGLGSLGRESFAVGLADHTSGGWREECEDGGRIAARDRTEGLAPGPIDGSRDRRPGPTNGLWADADWLGCRDGKWRPVEPGTFPLAHGVSGRVGRLRAYGNAIVPAQAAEFIGAYLDTY